MEEFNKMSRDEIINIVKSLTEKLESLKSELAKEKEENENLKIDINNKASKILSLSTEIIDLKSQYENRINIVKENVAAEIYKLNIDRFQTLNEKDKEIRELAEIAKSVSSNLEKTNKENIKKIKELEDKIYNKDNEIVKLNETITGLKLYYCKIEANYFELKEKIKRDEKEVASIKKYKKDINKYKRLWKNQIESTEIYRRKFENSIRYFKDNGISKESSKLENKAKKEIQNISEILLSEFISWDVKKELLFYYTKLIDDYTTLIRFSETWKIRNDKDKIFKNLQEDIRITEDIINTNYIY